MRAALAPHVLASQSHVILMSPLTHVPHTRSYAPMSDVGGLLYDKDAVYIDIPDWKVRPKLPSQASLPLSLVSISHDRIPPLFLPASTIGISRACVF